MKFKIKITKLILITFSFATLIISSTKLYSENVIENAKKEIYHENYNKAIKSLTEYLKNIKLKESEIEEASFYLGRAYILENKIQEAKKVYQNVMQIISASALNMVGLGSVLLLEGNLNEALTLFDNAILQSKSKKIEIYTALAYAYITAKKVDAKYAQNKFSLIPEKTKKNEEFYIALGDFYKRLRYGNEAYSNYQLALNLQPNNPAAKYRLAKLYLNQSNKELFEQNMIDVTLLDKTFTPAFYELYIYYYNSDVTKSKSYFLKYKELAEPSIALEFEEANVLFASKEFKTSLDKTLGMINNYKEKVDLRCYRLAGYTYAKLGDTINAIKFLETFLTKADIDDINIENYRMMANLLSSQPNNEAEVAKYYEKAYIVDTIPLEKVTDVKYIISAYKKSKNNKMVAYWYGILWNINPKQSPTDLFNWGYNTLIAGDIEKSDTIFSTYISKYPNEYFGYYWKGRAKAMLDSTLETAIPLYTKTIEIVSIDSIKYKNILIQSYGVLYAYYRNTLKNYESSVEILSKLIALKPEDKDLIDEQNKLIKYIEDKKKAEAKKKK